jgi:hypothetical protein
LKAATVASLADWNRVLAVHLAGAVLDVNGGLGFR